MPLDFSLRFLIVLGSILVPFWPPKWAPGGAPILRESAGWGSKTVPRSSWFGPFFVLSFGIAFLVVLGSFLGAPGVVLVLFRQFNSSIQPINSSIHRFNPCQLIDSTHQLINSSIQPINSSTHRFNSSSHHLIDSTHQFIDSSVNRLIII